MSARATLDAAMTEAQLEAAIVELCQRLGLEVATINDGLYRQAVKNQRYDEMRGAEGFVDLVIVGPRGVIWAELKSAKGKIRTSQERWRDAILAAGGEWYLWRPAQWSDGTVEETLRRLV